MTKHTLYADKAQRKFYWVPNDSELPEGDYRLADLRRQFRHTTEEGVAEYQIDEAQAKELAREMMSTVAKQASSFVAKTAAAVRELQQMQSVPVTPEAGPADRLAASIGLTQEELRTDPEKVKTGITDLLMGVAEAVKAAAKDEAERSPELTAGIARMKLAAMEEFGEEIGDGVGDWPEKLAEALKNPQLEQGARDAAERLKKMAAEVRASGVAASEVLEE